MDVGFLGLGAMGRHMAANLLKAGHRVRVWNRSPAPAEALVAQGAERAASPREALGAEAVLVMLWDDAATRAVLLDGGVLDAMAPGAVLVNHATLSVALVEELTERARARGLAYVSAPVFGRPEAAAAAQLHIVAAGEAAAMDRVQPLFDALGQKTWRLGAAPVQANVVKMAGNFMIASAIEAMGEAVALGRGHGVEPRALLEMLTGSLFSAPVYKNYGSIIAEQRYDSRGAQMTLGLKDVRLVLAAGDRAGVPLPFASVLRDAFLEGIANGDGERDWASLAEVARRRAGQKPNGER